MYFTVTNLIICIYSQKTDSTNSATLQARGIYNYFYFTKRKEGGEERKGQKEKKKKKKEKTRVGREN